MKKVVKIIFLLCVVISLSGCTGDGYNKKNNVVNDKKNNIGQNSNNHTLDDIDIGFEKTFPVHIKNSRNDSYTIENIATSWDEEGYYPVLNIEMLIMCNQ